jgi:hypothetical protein
MPAAPDDQDSAPRTGVEPAARPLLIPRRESFALARAAGLTLIAAHTRAGYAPDRGDASHLAAKPEVAARIAWLQVQRSKAAASDTEAAIVRLLDMADGADLSTAAGIREAREALDEARRLYADLRKLRALADAAAA